MVDPDLAAQYPFYYEGVIQGFKVGQKQISGITTPNATTIVFKLTKPVGDFLYRLMLPAAAPVPKEVAECFKTEPGAYGRYIVSSGPYMIEGAEKDEPWTGCGAAAYSGFNPNTGKLNLVRNPAYNPASDEPGLRPAYLDRLEFTANSNESDIVNKILAGELDGEQEVSSFELIKAAATNNVGEQLKVGPSDLVQYLGMNLTQPPFDDVHVRRAVNYVIDKEAVLRTLGGKQAGTIATHIVPDSMLENQLEGYEPYGSPEGDLAAAKREMKKSKYGNAEGMCDAPECKEIYAVNEPGEEAKTQVIVSELKEIGLELQVKTVQNYDTEVRKPSLNIAMWLLAGWGKDYKDAGTFIEPLFDSKAINGEATYNYGLVGLTPKVASEIGVEGDVNNIPNVDGEIEKCQPLSGKARSTCWAKLDEKLTTEVVSLVPLYVQNLVRLVGPEVTSWASAWEKVPFGNGSRPAYNWIAVESE
jgi:peptide/nickel transport system substrate-binding protein